MDQAYRALLDAAVRAPSGDNMQPWRFRVDAARGRIAIYLDEARDLSPMNSGQRMSRLAIGAALENMLHAADTLGWRVEGEEPVDSALAVLKIVRCDTTHREVDSILFSRVTNRRVYDGRPVPSILVDELSKETPGSGDARTYWINDPARIKSLALLISRSDGVMFGNRSMRRAFLGNVRLDAPSGVTVDEGLSLASLEVSRLDRWGLVALSRLPDRLAEMAGVTRVFEKQARKLVESASGICLVTASGNGVNADIDAGRALQRAWLALTARRLAVQPMMSLPVLENALQHGSADLVTSLGRETVEALLRDAQSLLPELIGSRMACLLRFGYSDPPSGRTGRLPLSRVVQDAGDVGADRQLPQSR